MTSKPPGRKRNPAHTACDQNTTHATPQPSPPISPKEQTFQAAVLVLDGKGGQFWASSWKDTEDHRLEGDLAQILEEILLRHHQLVEQRRAEQERLEARQRRLEDDRARAVVQYRKHFLIEMMKNEADRWERAILLRRYADAVRAETGSLEGAELEQALSWAMQIEAQAAMYDPLPDAARVPEIPEPSRSDLEKFM